jgi:hypothetical protein
MKTEQIKVATEIKSNVEVGSILVFHLTTPLFNLIDRLNNF